MTRHLENSLFAILLGFALCIISAGATTADTVSFSNGSSKRIWVAVFYHRPGCDISNFQSQGWWELAPGQTAIVYSGEHRTWFYYYAENEVGEQYTDTRNFACVPRRAFTWCTSICNSDPDTRNLGFRELYIGGTRDYTLNLIR